MLKKTLTYEDVDGTMVTEDFYFNITKAELIKMELSTDGGMENKINRIVASDNTREIFAIFEEIVRASFGVRTVEGKFVKNSEKTEEFLASEGYSALFMDLIENQSVDKFINGMMPKDLVQEVKKSGRILAVTDVELPEPLSAEDFQGEVSEEEMLAALGVVEEPKKDYSKLSVAEIRALPRKELIAAYKQKALGE